MSDLLSPEDNPRGYSISAVAAVLCGFILLPTVGLFLRPWRRLHSRLGTLGVWLYCLGLLAALFTGAFIYLTYVFFTPQYFAGRRWLLALLEWILAAIIAAGTLSLTMLTAESVNLPPESCGLKQAIHDGATTHTHSEPAQRC